MKTVVSSTATETTVRTRRGRTVRAVTHTLTLSCGHVAVRTFHTGSKDIPPATCKCGECE